MQDKDSTRSSINKRMNVVHRCIRTPNIVLRALRSHNVRSTYASIDHIVKYEFVGTVLFAVAPISKQIPRNRAALMHSDNFADLV